MKYFIPQILIVLFVNLAGSDNGKGEPNFGGYGSYVTYPFQFLGILTFAFTLFLFSVGFAKPDLYESLAKPQNKDAEEFLEQHAHAQGKDVAVAENTEGESKEKQDDNVDISAEKTAVESKEKQDDNVEISSQPSEEEAC
jgi:hypothetical protein